MVCCNNEINHQSNVMIVLCLTEAVEPELLHTYSRVYRFDVVLLIVRLAVLTAVTLTVPVVLFPVSISLHSPIT